MSESPQPLNALPQGYRLQEYELVRVLGFGGFGMTYLGFDHNLDKPVAIKEYLPSDIAVRTADRSVAPQASEFRGDFQWGLERFVDEARTLARFDHRHIIKVHRFFEAHGTAYIVMEYAEGETLSAYLERKGPLQEAELKAIHIYALGGVCYRALTGQGPEDATDRVRHDPLVPVAQRCAGRASGAFLSAVDWALSVDEGDRPQRVGAWREAMEGAAAEKVVEDAPLSFYRVASEGPLPVEFMDAETGSRWNMLGQAVAGPLAGRRLAQVPAYNAMWFAWTAYWPDTEVWQPGEGILSPEDIEQGTAVSESLDAAPTSFALRQNFPNPFNAQTLIQYELPAAGAVQLGVFNAAGQRVRSLVKGHQGAGLYLQPWDGRDDAGAAVASGTYLCRLELPAARFSQTRAMTLVR